MAAGCNQYVSGASGHLTALGPSDPDKRNLKAAFSTAYRLALCLLFGHTSSKRNQPKMLNENPASVPGLPADADLVYQRGQGRVTAQIGLSGSDTRYKNEGRKRTKGIFAPAARRSGAPRGK